MNKEQIYDQQIAPLMTQIIEICKEHKLAMIASFATPNDDEPELVCTTTLLEDEYEPHDAHIRAYRALFNRCAVPGSAITVTQG